MAKKELFKGLKETFAAVFPATDVISYVGQISDGGCAQLHAAIASYPSKSKRVVVWISTTGGDANAAYRMARCLQRNYRHVSAYVSTLCKSAGTLMAIGAHELIMGDEAELGPLDIQIQKRDELWEYGSGLDSLEALDVLKSRALATFRDHVLEMRMNGIPTKIASEVAKTLTLGLLGPIAGHLDPVSLGETNRRLRIAREYSIRLDRTSDNLKDADALDSLLTGYPSHGFVINREEVESLFNRVRPPIAEEAGLFLELSKFLRISRSAAASEVPKTSIVNSLFAEKDVTDETTEDPDGNN